MATDEKQTAQPKARAVHHVRLGRISATVWEAEGENGPRYSVSFQRSYRLPEEQRSGKDDDGWRNTNFYARDDCLIVGEAGRQAALWIHRKQQGNGQGADDVLTTLADVVAARIGEQQPEGVPF
jgi:hypothetical protein